MVTLFALLPLVIHELGHYGAAFLCGSHLHFVFQWGRLWKIPIPRWTWAWPNTTPPKIRFICQAGFLVELGLIPLMPWPYQVAAIIHFAAYPWYAGDESDFRGMV